LGDFLPARTQATYSGLEGHLDPGKPYLACRWWPAGLSRKDNCSEGWIVSKSWIKGE